VGSHYAGSNNLRLGGLPTPLSYANRVASLSWMGTPDWYRGWVSRIDTPNGYPHGIRGTKARTIYFSLTLWYTRVRVHINTAPPACYNFLG